MGDEDREITPGEEAAPRQLPPGQEGDEEETIASAVVRPEGEEEEPSSAAAEPSSDVSAEAPQPAEAEGAEPPPNEPPGDGHAGEPSQDDEEGPPETGEGEEEEEDQGADEGQDGSADAQPPPEAMEVPLPVVGRVPLKAVAALALLAGAAFVAVLVFTLDRWRGEPAPAGPPPPLVAAGAQREDAEAPPAIDLGAMTYQELMELARQYESHGDDPSAARAYRAAAERAEAGLPEALFARYRLSCVLNRSGRHEEAHRICEALRAVSRPGDELWKCAVLGSVRALYERGEWGEMFRHAYLLRANTARYPEEAALNRWLAYCKAMARATIYLQAASEGEQPFEMSAPVLGRAECPTRPLAAGDILPDSGRYGDGSCEATYEGGELHLSAQAAPIGRVLAAVSEASGLPIDYRGPADYVVSASLETISVPHALELVLGSAGLSAEQRDGGLVVRDLDVMPRSRSEALKGAQWALQEFLILYPESAHVGEAYYALAYLYVLEGQREMALDQLDVLSKECPRSPWSTYGRYLAGRLRYEMGQWARAERDLLAVVDAEGTHPLERSAFLHAAQCQVQLGRYEEAVTCFRRALAGATGHPLAPGILYNIAYCLERSGASPLEVEERYLELRTRYAGTDYAREADYRLARMALEGGRYEKAVTRYEAYLAAWSIDDERGRSACADLVRAYGATGDHVRAALLGHVMCNAFAESPQFWQCLPALVSAHRRAGMAALGLELLEGCREAAEDADRRGRLCAARAGFLADLGRTEEALAALDEMPAGLADPEVLHAANLVRAGLLTRGGQPEAAARLCREVALRSADRELRAAALKLIARQYELRKEFDKVALVYSGKVPLEPKGEAR